VRQIGNKPLKELTVRDVRTGLEALSDRGPVGDRAAPIAHRQPHSVSQSRPSGSPDPSDARQRHGRVEGRRQPLPQLERVAAGTGERRQVPLARHAGHRETKDGEKRTVNEVEVDDVGPSLRNTSAKVSKAERRSQSAGGQGGFGGSREPARGRLPRPTTPTSRRSLVARERRRLSPGTGEPYASLARVLDPASCPPCRSPNRFWLGR
jgi:hypothetical protein